MGNWTLHLLDTLPTRHIVYGTFCLWTVEFAHYVDISPICEAVTYALKCNKIVARIVLSPYQIFVKILLTWNKLFLRGKVSLVYVL